MTEHGQARAGRPVPTKTIERRLLFALLAAPVAWMLHEVVGFSVVGRRCAVQGGLLVWQWAALIGVGALSFGVAALAAVIAYGIFRGWSQEAAILKSEGWNRVSFMARLGFFLSMILLVNIVFFGLLPWIVHPCATDVAFDR